MKLGFEHSPLFLRRELKFLFGIFLALGFLLEQMGCATSSVIEMPKSLPDIVKSYKSVYLHAGSTGMNNTFVEVKAGDYITILAKGIINLGGGKEFGPKVLLSYQFSDGDVVRQYRGPEIIKIHPVYLKYKESGNIYLSYIDRYVFNQIHQGYFLVDIIFWKRNDPKRVAKFLEEASLANPNDNDLKEIAQQFKKSQEILWGLQKGAKEVEEIKKELSTIEAKKIEAKPVVTSSIKEQITETNETEGGKQQREEVAKKEEEKLATEENREEKRIEELTDKLQKALQAMKELEEMKRKLTEKEEKEIQLLARLEILEEQKSGHSKNLPVIAVAYPKDGLTLDSEYVNLYGMAEHEKGIMKFEIFVNKKLVVLKDQGDLPVVPRDRRRIEFSERIRLQEGQNTISINAQGTGGLTNQKNISIHLAKKREKVFGVVIGIDKYKNFPSLKYAVNDAREFYRYLTEVNQVPKEQVWLFLDEQATLDKLRMALGTSLRRSAGKDDTVIIFLAGHGATEQDASSLDGDGLEKYILPYNADPQNLYGSAIPMSEIARIFQRISSERLVFIGDTCYSGGSGGRTILVAGKRANVSGAFLERVAQGRGRVILTASDANEVSVEKDELKHGVFTYYLLEGLRGKADFDKDGVITVDELYRYVSIKVPQATGQDQHPVKKGEVIGEIVLGVVK